MQSPKVQYDSNNNYSEYQYTDADGDSVADEIASITDPFGHQISYTYSSGKLSKITDDAGRETTYTYTSGLISQVTFPDPDGSGTTYSSPVEKFTYNGDGRLTKYEDPRGNSTEYTYDVAGRLDTITHPDTETRVVDSVVVLGLETGKNGKGQPYPLPYDDLEAHLTDGRGHVVKVQTDDFGNHIVDVNAEGDTVFTERNADGLPVKITEVGDGSHVARVTLLYYNDDGMITRLVTPDAREQKWEYDTTAKKPSKYTDELGRVTNYTYDVFGNLLSVWQTLSGHVLEPNTLDTSNLYQHNAYNRLDIDGDGSITQADAEDAIDWLNTYNATSVTGPASDGKFYDVNGDASITAFDAIQVINYLNMQLQTPKVITRYTYTSAADSSPLSNLPKGLPLTKTDPLGHVTTYEYETNTADEDFGRLISITEGYGTADAATTQFDYDAAGNLTSVIDPLSRETKYEFDNLDRLAKVIEPHPSNPALDGPTTAYEYDEAGNLISVTDPLTFVTTYDYDEMNRLEKVTQPIPVGSNSADAPVTTLAYDENGNLTSITDPLSRVTSYAYDKADRVEKTTYPNSTYAESVYNVFGQIETSKFTGTGTGSGTASTEYTYDVRGRLLTVTPPSTSNITGTVLPETYAYDAAGQLISHTDRLGQKTDYRYDSLGRLARVILPTPGSSGSRPEYKTAYDLAGNVRAQIDPNGNFTEWRYDPLDRIAKIREMDPDGTDSGTPGVTEFTYDDASQLTLVTNPRGGQTKYEYDRIGRPTQFTDGYSSGLDALTQFVYDAAGNLTQVTDPLNRVVTLAYDRLHRLLSESGDTDGMSYTYDKASQLLTQTDGLSRVTTYDYDSMGRIASVLYPAPGGGATQPEITYGYQDLGTSSVVTIEDNLNDGVVRTYNAWGLLTSENHEGSTTTYNYDPVGNLLKITDPLSRATEFDYDHLNRRVMTTDPDPDGAGGVAASETEYAYDLAGNLLTIIDPLDHETNYTYDPRNRRIASKDALDGETLFEYDNADNLTKLTDPVGNETSWTFDILDRVTQETNELSQSRYFEYDTAGNLTKRTDRLGRVIKYSYDDMNRVLQEKWWGESGWTELYPSASASTTVAGDPADEEQTISISDTDGGTFTLTFDGQTTAAIAWNASTGAVETALEALTNINNVSVTGTVGSSYVVTFVGTQSGTDVAEMTVDFSSLSNSELKNVLSFEYDVAGQLGTAEDQFASYEYTYDGMGRLDTETQNIVGLPEIVFDSGYNVKSGRTSLSATVDGTADFLRTYTRDEWNRVTELVESGQSGGNGVVRKEVDFDYNAAHQYESITRYEGTSPTLIATTSFTYDGAGRLEDLHHTRSSTTLARYEYVFDLAGRIEQITSYVDGVSDFTYDDTNQLTDADHAGSGPPDETYDYDANGNQDGAGFDVDPNNQISTDGTYNYTYDAEGNRSSKTLISTGDKEEYTWDHRNRLVTITFKDAYDAVTKTVDQTYDVFNQWIKRTVDPDGAGAADAIDTYFAYEDGQIVFQWEDADGAGGSDPAMSHRYLWAEGVDQFLADEQISTPGSAGNVLWGLGDNLGTLRDILDLSGGTVSVVNHRDYNAFGSLTSETNAAIDLLFGYTSRPFDEASGVQNNLNRWYDPVLKQWLSEDPIGFAANDLNLRRYVFNLVNSLTDPDGLRDGHHFVPQSVFNALNAIKGFMNADALAVFTGDKMDPELYNHGFDTWNTDKHSEYNKAVKELLEKYKAQIKRTLTADDAKEFLEFIKGNKALPELAEACPNAIGKVRSWLAGFYQSIAKARAIEEAGVKLTKEEMKDAVRHFINDRDIPKGLQKKLLPYTSLDPKLRRASLAKHLGRIAPHAGKVMVVFAFISLGTAAAQGAQGNAKFPEGGISGAYYNAQYEWMMGPAVEAYVFPAIESKCDAIGKSLGIDDRGVYFKRNGKLYDKDYNQVDDKDYKRAE